MTILLLVWSPDRHCGTVYVEDRGLVIPIKAFAVHQRRMYDFPSLDVEYVTSWRDEYGSLMAWRIPVLPDLACGRAERYGTLEGCSMARASAA